MHKLDRESIATPACISQYLPGTHTWDDVTGSDKERVRACLIQMQGERCAYCEGPVRSGNWHVEHFFRKSDYRNRTFDWLNLFLSCSSKEHCGRFKDRSGAAPYLPSDLIKPDIDDPDQCLYFHSNGQVRSRSGIGPAEEFRATETIRVLNLESPRLKEKRRAAVMQYVGRDSNFIEELMVLEEHDRSAFLDFEIASTASEPYCTAIRHLLRRHS